MDVSFGYRILVFIFVCGIAFSGRSQIMPYAGSPYPFDATTIPNANYIDKLSLEFESSINSEIESNVSLYLQALPFPAVTRLKKHKHLMLDEAQGALRALGYYQGQIDIDLHQQGSVLIATVGIVAGPAARVTNFSLSLLGEGATDLSFINLNERLKFTKGQVFHHGRYESLKSEYNSLALQKGYFDAQWLKHEVSLDVEQGTVDIHLVLDLKQRYHFGDISIEPPDTPAADIIRELATFSLGEPYNSRQVADYSIDLSSTSYFKSVIVRPLVEHLEDAVVPMEVKVVPKSSNIFKIGGGFSTDVSFRGQLYWTRPWINRWGHSITGGLEGSNVQQMYSLSYQIPIKDPVNDYFNVVGGIIRKIVNDTDSREITLQGQRLQKFASNWQRALFLRWQRDYYRQAEQQTVSDLIIPGVSFTYSHALGALDPYHGYQQIFTLELSDPAWGSDERLMKARTFTKLIRQLGSTHRITTRLDLGGIWVDEIDSVPSSMRFFAGGDQSIRAYAYESIAPRNKSNKLIGGLYLVVGSMEYSYPVLKNWRLATFIDSGTATDDFSERISTGAGLGLRWLTPIGPVKFDFGFPVSESEPLKNWRFHLTFGPSL